ncbi:MAG: hypothetical protein WC906_04880 [Parcubacteria group bacterium]|jgi:hypothetical protein
MLNNAQKQIIAAIVYYDELNYPLTAFEVWKHLAIISEQDASEQEKLFGISLLDVMNNLESGEARKYIEEYRGFYFMEGRKELVESRLKKNKIACLKLKKLRRVVYFLRFVPFVRMIATTGRMAMKNTSRNSDWDLFVILKKGKIWTGRTLVTVFIHMIGKRRYGNKIKNRICLNYFITDESLKINIEGRPFEVNLFSANEYSFMIPFFGFKTFRKFQIRNSWIKKFKPNFEISEARNPKMVSDSRFSKVIRKCGERLLRFNFIENLLRRIEREKIANNPKTHKTGSIIEANDTELAFLPEPQGKEIYERCREKLVSLGIV